MTQRTEELEQARLIKWTHFKEVREAAPMLAFLFHTPNGGARSGFTGAQMKALGVVPGVPDLLLPYRFGASPGLAIEMKSATGRTSDEQNDWLNHLTNEGWNVHICRSATEAANAICEYLGIDRSALPPIDRPNPRPTAKTASKRLKTALANDRTKAASLSTNDRPTPNTTDRQNA